MCYICFVLPLWVLLMNKSLVVPHSRLSTCCFYLGMVTHKLCHCFVPHDVLRAVYTWQHLAYQQASGRDLYCWCVAVFPAAASQVSTTGMAPAGACLCQLVASRPCRGW